MHIQPAPRTSRRACPEPELALSPPKGRGGRRPGAGAPRGNLNALKHGETSRQIEHLALALSLIPDTRRALVRLMKRQRRQQAQARTVAILTNLLKASLQALNNQPPAGACPERSRRATLIPDSPRPIRSSNSRKINQPTLSSSPDQSNPPHPLPSSTFPHPTD